MIARVRRWGNSLAVRLRRQDIDRVGISDGDLVRVEIAKVTRPRSLGLDDLPTFEDTDPKASVRHDRYLYG